MEGSGIVINSSGHKICSTACIRARSIDAKYQREIHKLRKGQLQLDKDFQSGELRNLATQRGIVSLLGHDIYLDPGVKSNPKLFGQNIPGFCYRRNGIARRHCSALSSKENQTIHSLNAQDSDFREDLASNVLSDNPLLSELLSSPEVLPILCDLRTTAVLRHNSALLDEFVTNLKTAPLNEGIQIFLRHWDLNAKPSLALRKYRNFLIQHLFDMIQIQAQIRLNPTLSVRIAELTNLTPSAIQALTFESKSNSPILTQEKFLQATIPVKPTVEASLCQIVRLVEDDPPTLSPEGRALKVERRAKFNSFITSLINEVETVNSLRGVLRSIHRKHPGKCVCSVGVLQRLLKTEPFGDQNVEYCSLLTDGPNGLCPFECPEYHLPNTCTSQQTIGTDSTLEQPGGSPQSASLKNADKALNEVRRRHLFTPKSVKLTLPSEVQPTEEGLRTKNRVCCPACRIKLREACDKSRERDLMYQKQIEQSNLPSIGELLKEISKLEIAEDGISFETSPLALSRIFDLDSFTPLRSTNSLNVRSPNMQSISKFLENESALNLSASVRIITTPEREQFGVPDGDGLNQTSKTERPLTSNRSKPWTLQVSRLDLIKLQAELEYESVKEQVDTFTRSLSGKPSQELSASKF